MSRESYKRLGDYIHEVNLRNRDLAVTELVGLTIDKAFISSVANIIGTDLSNYKIIRKEQFACSLMQVSRDEKIPVAMFYKEIAIMSPAYPVFEVIDKNELLPQYLMMWFSRSEFDREASFYAVGGVRGSLTWEDFCNLILPIPSIEKQREVVAEYEVLTRRIHINEILCEKLEAIIQALYRKMFVESIDLENLPIGWKMGTLSDVASFCYGKLPDKIKKGSIPIYTGYGITGYTKDCMFDKSHIIVVARGDAGSGRICLSPDRFFLSNLAIAVILKDESIKHYLYYHLLNADTTILRSGSAQAQVTISSLEPYEILIPNNDICVKFDRTILSLCNMKNICKIESVKLNRVKSLLLSKLAIN